LAVIEVNGLISGQLDDLTSQLVRARYEDQAWVAETTSVLSAMGAVAAKARGITPLTRSSSPLTRLGWRESSRTIGSPRTWPSPSRAPTMIS
jgi:hypothetical protein